MVIVQCSTFLHSCNWATLCNVNCTMTRSESILIGKSVTVNCIKEMRESFWVVLLTTNVFMYEKVVRIGTNASMLPQPIKKTLHIWQLSSQFQDNLKGSVDQHYETNSVILIGCKVDYISCNNNPYTCYTGTGGRIQDSQGCGDQLEVLD